MDCIKCKKNKAQENEEIGLGKYCESCLEEENKIWKEESGFN